MECGDTTTQEAVAAACGAECSYLVAEGTIPSELYDDEWDFALKIYDGYDEGGYHVAGVLESFPECSSSRCQELAEENKVIYVGFHHMDWDEVLGNLEVGSMIAESHESDRGTLHSDNFSGASLNPYCAHDHPMDECPY